MNDNITDGVIQIAYIFLVLGGIVGVTAFIFWLYTWVRPHSRKCVKMTQDEHEWMMDFLRQHKDTDKE